MTDSADRPHSSGPGNPPWAWRFLVGGVTNVLRFVFGWKLHAHVEGDLPPSDGPAVLVVNHTGQLEPFLVSHATWKRTGRWVRPLAKASLFKIPVLGFLANRAGGIPVFRESEQGRGNAYSAAIDCLAEGGTIYVAPEGTITHDGHLLPLRHGAARLALESGAPLIVLTSFGGQRAASPIVKFAHRNVRFDVHLEALYPEPGEDAASLTGRMAAMMIDRSEQLQRDYPDADHDAIWWPPYKEPAEPSKTAAKNLDQYREAMTEAVDNARERMTAMAAERDLESRIATARERARNARATARAKADEIRHRAEEMAELARKGELSDSMRHRAEELAHQARELAADMAEHVAEQLHVDDDEKAPHLTVAEHVTAEHIADLTTEHQDETA